MFTRNLIMISVARIVSFICIRHTLLLFFFFQAEDGIRDKLVTGVQTCALPIFREIALLETFARQAVIAIENSRLFSELQQRTDELTHSVSRLTALFEVGQAISRSEERRVGKECRSRWSR